MINKPGKVKEMNKNVLLDKMFLCPRLNPKMFAYEPTMSKLLFM